jgi:hypothetical protein
LLLVCAISSLGSLRSEREHYIDRRTQRPQYGHTFDFIGRLRPHDEQCFLSVFALHVNPSLVPFRDRHRICSPQSSLLRNLDVSRRFLHVNHLSFLMVFPDREAAICYPFVEDLLPHTPCGASGPSSWRASGHGFPMLGARLFRPTLYHRQRLPLYRVASAYGRAAKNVKHAALGQIRDSSPSIIRWGSLAHLFL